jgi:type I restriction enzyme, S subunit
MNISDGRRMDESRTYLDQASADAYRVRLWPPGTVIFPKQGGAIATNKKRVLTKTAACDLNTMGVVPTDAIISDYLWLVFEAIDLPALSDGSVVAQIKPSRVANLEIPLPPAVDQARIIARAERHLSVIDSLLVQVQAAVRRAASLRRAVLDQAFSGRLTSQEASDEPAAALLERILARRDENGSRRRGSTGRTRKATA